MRRRLFSPEPVPDLGQLQGPDTMIVTGEYTIRFFKSNVIKHMFYECLNVLQMVVLMDNV